MHERTAINSAVVMLCHKRRPIAITGHTIEFDTIYIYLNIKNCAALLGWHTYSIILLILDDA